MCRERWPTNRYLLRASLNYAAIAGDWDRFDRWAEDLARLDPGGQAGVRGVVRFGLQLRRPDAAAREARLSALRAETVRTGTVRLDTFTELSSYGFFDEAFDLVKQASFAHMFDADGPRPGGSFSSGVIFGERPGIVRDVRFPSLCAKMGLSAYWVQTGRWPDCADEDRLPYDFKAECRRLAAQ